MHEGVVVFFKSEKLFGFIEEHIPVPGGGYLCQKYCFNRNRITFQMSQEIKTGQFARFNVLEFFRKSNEAPVATDIELFDTVEQMKVYTDAMGVK